jgi:hypothetical protein
MAIRNVPTRIEGTTFRLLQHNRKISDSASRSAAFARVDMRSRRRAASHPPPLVRFRRRVATISRRLHVVLEMPMESAFLSSASDAPQHRPRSKPRLSRRRDGAR